MNDCQNIYQLELATSTTMQINSII